MSQPAIVHVSSFPPTRCGIAEYTATLAHHMDASDPKLQSRFVRMDTSREKPEQSEDGIAINPSDPSAFDTAASAVGQWGKCVLLLQHEFKLYGGSDGTNLLRLLQSIRAPIVTTLHTVCPSLPPARHQLFVELLRHSKLVLVFSDRAAAILFERYASDPRRVRVIPHGVPDVPFRLPDDADYPGLPSRKMRFITAGLIRPAKGIEHALAALKTLKKSFSDFTYVIAGADHPKSSAAAQYRQTLLTLITEYGLENHVVLVDRFLDAREMHNLIQACHAGILPYAAPDQSSSGVLALLLACGRPVIASDFQYSRAILNDRIGAVVPALDTKAAG